MRLKPWLFAAMILASGDVMAAPPIASSTASASNTVAVSTLVVSTTPIVLTPRTNNAFHIGERLEFAIKYEFIYAGTAVMEIAEGPTVLGRPTYQLETRADSNKMVDKFFKVRDFNSSVIDKETLVSLNFHQNLKEGHYHVIRNTALDYKNRTYKFQRIRRGTITERTGPIHEPLSDILSSFFITRTLPLEPGKNYAITVFSDEEVYALAVIVHSKIQRVTVPAGTFDCLRIEPMVNGDAIFQAKEGRMTIWLTNDERKMPVLIRSKVFIGSVDAELKSFKLGTGPDFDTVGPK